MQTWGKCWKNGMTWRAMRLQVRTTEKPSFQRKQLGFQKIVGSSKLWKKNSSVSTNPLKFDSWKVWHMPSLKSQTSLGIVSCFCIPGISPNTPSLKKANLRVSRWPRLFRFPEASCLDLARLPTSPVKLITVTSLLAWLCESQWAFGQPASANSEHLANHKVVGLF